MTTTEPASPPAKPKRRLVWRLVLVLLGLALLALALAFVFGPREPARLTTDFGPAVIGADPARYLAGEEANVPNLRPEAEKEIVWAYPASRAKTPLAIVYIHGFSASKGETRPLADAVARELGANLFYVRLAGHGRDAAAMAEPTVGDWIDDFAEAMAIGRRIGERVVVIGTSTGATLATVGASRPDLSEGLAALVEISPNFGLRNWRSFLLTVPFARDLLPWLGPETYASDVSEGAPDGVWTRSYPTAALLPMARLVEVANRLDLSTIQTPALFLYSPRDEVVDPERTVALAGRWGGPHELVPVEDSTDPSQHVIAGDLRSPGTTEPLARRIADWIRQTLGA
ncbi:carboxylesterase [Aureimonas sp. SK2]|uniref:alpha/beta hydrolase n=1 Tax=Aureimonas sp. SK2 TaxID=3015992 RepID=UPI0024449E2C|nr:alpha/beta fold hydrolase [Aureimonas sp. SK2]